MLPRSNILRLITNILKIQIQLVLRSLIMKLYNDRIQKIVSFEYIYSITDDTYKDNV